jgi:hypothetical protein
MARDPIIDEVRQFRDAYAKRFHYDLEAICRDIRARQTQCGRKVVSLPPKPVQASIGSKEKSRLQAACVLQETRDFLAAMREKVNAHES